MCHNMVERGPKHRARRQIEMTMSLYLAETGLHTLGNTWGLESQRRQEVRSGNMTHEKSVYQSKTRNKHTYNSTQNKQDHRNRPLSWRNEH